MKFTLSVIFLLLISASAWSSAKTSYAGLQTEGAPLRSNQYPLSSDSIYWINNFDSIAWITGPIDFQMSNNDDGVVTTGSTILYDRREASRFRVENKTSSLVLTLIDSERYDVYPRLVVNLVDFDTLTLRASSAHIKYEYESSPSTYQEFRSYAFDLIDLQFEKDLYGSVFLDLSGESLQSRLSAAQYGYYYKNSEHSGQSTSFTIPFDATFKLWFGRRQSTSSVSSVRLAQTQHPIVISPQPTTGLSNIYLSMQEDVTLAVYDMAGKQVDPPFTRDHDRITFDLAKQLPGVYLVIASDGKQFKLVKL